MLFAWKLGNAFDIRGRFGLQYMFDNRVDINSAIHMGVKLLGELVGGVGGNTPCWRLMGSDLEWYMIL